MDNSEINKLKDNIELNSLLGEDENACYLNTVYYFKLGELTKDLHYYEKGIEMLNKSIQINKKALYYSLRAKLNHKLNKIKECLDDCKEASGKLNEVPSEVLEVYEIKNTLDQITNSNEVKEFLQKSNLNEGNKETNINNKDKNQAKSQEELDLEFCNKILKKKPSSCKIYDLKGISLIKLKKYEEALESYDKAIGLDPDNLVYKSQRVKLLWLTGKEAQALEEFNVIKDKELNTDFNNLIFRQNISNIKEMIQSKDKTYLENDKDNLKHINYISIENKVNEISENLKVITESTIKSFDNLVVENNINENKVQEILLDSSKNEKNNDFEKNKINDSIQSQLLKQGEEIQTIKGTQTEIKNMLESLKNMIQNEFKLIRDEIKNLKS